MAGLTPPRVPDQPVSVFTAGDPPRLERACAGRAFAERRDAALIVVFGRPVSASRSWPESAPAPAAREPAAATTASWRTGRDTSHHRSKGTAARTAKSGRRPQITVRQCRPALTRCLMSYSHSRIAGVTRRYIYALVCMSLTAVVIGNSASSFVEGTRRTSDTQVIISAFLFRKIE
jgi:hypothetical protein